jgi:hypothetical protein
MINEYLSSVQYYDNFFRSLSFMRIMIHDLGVLWVVAICFDHLCSFVINIYIVFINYYNIVNIIICYQLNEIQSLFSSIFPSSFIIIFHLFVTDWHTFIFSSITVFNILILTVIIYIIIFIMFCFFIVLHLALSNMV